MAIPTLIMVGVTVFILVRIIPGDPASLMLGDVGDAAALAALRERLGLDRSLPEQFVIWAGLLLQGDMGTSIATGQPVLQTIISRFLIKIGRAHV